MNIANGLGTDWPSSKLVSSVSVTVLLHFYALEYVFLWSFVNVASESELTDTSVSFCNKTGNKKWKTWSGNFFLWFCFFVFVWFLFICYITGEIWLFWPSYLPRWEVELVCRMSSLSKPKFFSILECVNLFETCLVRVYMVFKKSKHTCTVYSSINFIHIRFTRQLY